MFKTTTVMLAGASGVGKSTLGNHLLHGRPDEGFVAGAGREAVTTACEARVDRSRHGSTFKVIDTPGTPSTAAGTKAYLNAIEQGARNAERLNAVVLVIEFSQNRMYRLSDMRNSAGLLRSFNKLGCRVFLACRVPGHLPGRNKEGIREAEQTWKAFVTEIKTQAGLGDDVATYILRAADMVSQAQEMRRSMTGCPSVRMPKGDGFQLFAPDKMSMCLMSNAGKVVCG